MKTQAKHALTQPRPCRRYFRIPWKPTEAVIMEVASKLPIERAERIAKAW